jgi:hypothetical protein
MKWVWHKYVLRHNVVKHGSIEPDEITSGGIRVFRQDSFRPPMAHYECLTCERTFI